MIWFAETVQSHATLAVIEKSPDGTYSLKALKQKLCIDGLCYLLQEVYGIENKTAGCSEVRNLYRDVSPYVHCAAVMG